MVHTSLGVLLTFVVLAEREEWLEMPALPVPRQEVGVAALDGAVYVIGGILAGGGATGMASRFSVLEGRWQDLDPLPDDTRLHHVGAASAQGKVYAVGGLDAGFRGVRSVFAYDPGEERWSRVADLPTARGAMGVASLDGKVYAAGGQSGGTTVRDFAAYDPGADRWDVLPEMPTARNHLAAAAVEGWFYAIGGRAGGLRSAVERFDPAFAAQGAEPWVSLSPIPTARGGIAAASLGGLIYVFGGEGNPASPEGTFEENEVYDPATDRWRTRCPMPLAVHGIGAAVVGDLIHVPGGAPVEGFGTTDIHQAYRPPAASFERRRGDADGDGEVDVGDAVFILFRLFAPGTDMGFPCPAGADVNADGVTAARVDLSDVTFLLEFLFRAGPPPPEI